MHGTVTTATDCREHAAVLLQQAAQTLDPVKRSEFEAWAKKWLVLARKIEHPLPPVNADIRQLKHQSA